MGKIKKTEERERNGPHKSDCDEVILEGSPQV